MFVGIEKNLITCYSFKMGSLEERMTLSHVFLPVSLIIIVSGYLELILDELGLIRVDLIV